jgi:hypothetical protein
MFLRIAKIARQLPIHAFYSTQGVETKIARAMLDLTEQR